MIKAVIFDMDGVIVDTNPYHTLAWTAFFERYGITVDKPDLIRNMFGRSTEHTISYFFKKTFSAIQHKALCAEKEAIFQEIYADKVEPVAGFMEFLDSLKAKGIKTAIATSAPRTNLELILNHLPIREKMEVILCEDDVQHHKPHPQVYLTAAERLGVRSEECLIFEDSISGVQAAINAHIKVIGVLTSHTPAELPQCQDYIHHFKEEIKIDSL